MQESKHGSVSPIKPAAALGKHTPSQRRVTAVQQESQQSQYCDEVKERGIPSTMSPFLISEQRSRVGHGHVSVVIIHTFCLS